VLVLSELLLILSRLSARWTFMSRDAAARRHLGDRGLRCDSFVQMIVKRDAYGNCCQALVAVALQLAASTFACIGLLIITSRLITHRDDGDEGRQAAWTVLYVFVVAAQVVAAIADVVRVRDIDAPHGWARALEFMAWRLVMEIFVVPVISLAFVIYSHVCCDGDWLW
jgi:hypothetical protein